MLVIFSTSVEINYY